MQKTSSVTFDKYTRPEIKLGTLLIDKNEDVWIVYSQYNLNNCFTYFNALCISSSNRAVRLYNSINPNISSDEAYKYLAVGGFEVFVGSVTITQK